MTGSKFAAKLTNGRKDFIGELFGILRRKSFGEAQGDAKKEKRKWLFF